MANTLNLGNGKWARKEGSLLAYNSENNNYKPLPFTFDRASSATRVNKDGLIETVGADEPRVDYLNDSNGALKLEPQRSNLFTYSEDTSQWTTSRGTATSNNIIAPNGELVGGLYEKTEDANEGYVYRNLTVSSVGTYSVSVFFKYNNSQYAHFLLFDGISSGARAWFDIQNGIVGTTTTFGTTFTVSDLNIEDYGNGWYKCSAKYVVTGTYTTWQFRVSPSGGNGVTNTDSGAKIYFFGTQIEEGSYPTSYIKTQGSAVTRLADVCNGAGNEQVINSTEGVLYAEIAALADDLTFRSISINANDTRDDQVMIRYRTNSNVISFFIRDGGSVTLNQNVIVQDITKYNKVALKYKNGDISAWINGVEYITSTATGMPSGLNKIGFQLEDPNVDPFFGNVKDIRVYNTALTDQELAALTT